MSAEVCQPMADDPIAQTVLIIQHFGTLIILLALLRTAYKTVEIRHPLYALLYQELILLAVFVTMNLFDLALMVVLDEDMNSTLTGIYFFIDVAALQLHQITCLSVACLR